MAIVRKDFADNLFDFKKDPKYKLLFKDIKQFIVKQDNAQLERIFLSLPNLLDENIQVIYHERLVQLVCSIDTIIVNKRVLEDNTKPELFNAHDKESIEYIQKELIFYISEQILEGFFSINSAIKNSLNIQDINISQKKLLYFFTINVLSRLTENMVKECLNKKVIVDHLKAVCHTLLDRKQIKTFVSQILSEIFVNKIEKFTSRKNLLAIINEQKMLDKDKILKFIESVKNKIAENDVSRAFDDFPLLLDTTLLKKFVDEYKKYFNLISIDNIITSEKSISFKSSNNIQSEDSAWLEHFQKCIVKIGIKDILDKQYAVNPDFKNLFNLDSSIEKIRLLDAYLSAIDQVIMEQAHPESLNQKDSHINVFSFAAVCDEINNKRLQWIKETYEEEINKQCSDLDIISKRYVNNKRMQPLTGMGSVQLALVAGLFAAFASGAVLANKIFKQDQVETNHPPLPKH